MVPRVWLSSWLSFLCLAWSLPVGCSRSQADLLAEAFWCAKARLHSGINLRETMLPGEKLSSPELPVRLANGSIIREKDGLLLLGLRL